MGGVLPNEDMGQSMTQSLVPKSSGGSDPIQGFMSDIFGGQLKTAALAAL